MRFDLHIHSSKSDGSYAPEAIPALAAEVGLSAISLTDHDTIEGLDACRAAAREAGLAFVNGLELSAYSFSEVHVLGYRFDAASPFLGEKLADFAQKRRERAAAILDRLERFGIFLDKERLLEQSSVGRLHIARELTAHGFCAGISEAFERYLGAGGCAYYPSKRTTPLEAVGIVKQADGLAVIAHPLRFLQQGKLRDLVEGLLPYGLDGLECYYPTHDAKAVEALEALCRRYGLLATGGTDFHGVNRNVALGATDVRLSRRTAEALGLNETTSSR